MSESKMGAKVMYCGHNGWFVADIFRIGDVNVVKANGPIKPENLVRGHNDEATHRVMDFPDAGCWSPDRGFLVVPEAQVTPVAPCGGPGWNDTGKCDLPRGHEGDCDVR